MKKRQRMARTLGMLGFLFAIGGTGSSAHADGSVSSLGMGMDARDAAAFARFQTVIAQYERFRIDSHCQSACTMFLSICNVRITPGATLLFHAGCSMQKGYHQSRALSANAEYLQGRLATICHRAPFHGHV